MLGILTVLHHLTVLNYSCACMHELSSRQRTICTSLCELHILQRGEMPEYSACREAMTIYICFQQCICISSAIPKACDAGALRRPICDTPRPTGGTVPLWCVAFWPGPTAGPAALRGGPLNSSRHQRTRLISDRPRSSTVHRDSQNLEAHLC